MRILHVCLACFYIDNYGYQENILPKIHKLYGHDVRIMASTETYIDNKQIGYVSPSKYFNENGILVERIPYRNFLFKKITRKLRFYKGIKKVLNDFQPDIIFMHDIQFCSIKEFKKYAVSHNVIIYADSHTDFINSCHTFFSRTILHGMIYKKCAKIIEPYVKKFFGVLPARCDFLNIMYKIPYEKIELLVMGVDDTLFNYNNKDQIGREIRAKYSIKDDDFVIITGGKIDKNKKVLELMKVFIKLNLEKCKLIVFGAISDDIKNDFYALSSNDNIIYVDWIKSSEIYKFFFSADLGVFLGTHSVLWEEAVGCGLPCLFKQWDGFTHVNVNGNCMFIEDNCEIDIEKALIRIIGTDISKMKEKANISREQFCYTNIAKKAIGE